MDRRQAQGLDLYICETGGLRQGYDLFWYSLWVSSEPAGSSPNSSLSRLSARAGFPECPGEALGTIQATSSAEWNLSHSQGILHPPASQIQGERLFPFRELEAIRATMVTMT